MLRVRIAATGAVTVMVATIVACQREQAQRPAQRPAATAAAARPHRRPGLWEQVTRFGTIEQVARICLDPAADEKLGLGGQAAKQPCEQTVTPRAGGGWTFASTCDMGENGKVAARGSASGDFVSAYRVEVETTTSGAVAPQMNGTRRFTTEAKWKGPCPAGMAPGMVELANGLRFDPAAGGGP